MVLVLPGCCCSTFKALAYVEPFNMQRKGSRCYQRIDDYCCLNWGTSHYLGSTNRNTHTFSLHGCSAIGQCHHHIKIYLLFIRFILAVFMWLILRIRRKTSRICLTGLWAERCRNCPQRCGSSAVAGRSYRTDPFEGWNGLWLGSEFQLWTSQSPGKTMEHLEGRSKLRGSSFFFMLSALFMFFSSYFSVSCCRIVPMLQIELRFCSFGLLSKLHTQIWAVNLQGKAYFDLIWSRGSFDSHKSSGQK